MGPPNEVLTLKAGPLRCPSFILLARLYLIHNLNQRLQKLIYYLRIHSSTYDLIKRRPQKEEKSSRAVLQNSY